MKSEKKKVGKKILLGTTQNEYLYDIYLDRKRVLLALNYINWKSVWLWEEVKIYKT